MSIQKRILEDDIRWTLQYLSLLKSKDGAHTKACFVKEFGFDTLRSMHFMWPRGVDYLSIFGDVVYCDSMWSPCWEGYFLLTIVIVDNEDKIRLAAASITPKEDKESWKSFFSWVKTIAPTFKPKCFVSDGASYIHKAFDETISRDTFHINCWWHQRQSCKRRKGTQKTLYEKVLAVVFGENGDLIEKRKNELKEKIEQTQSGTRAEKELLKLLEEQVEHAFINLKVFTGGTLTNSYAESVNNRLRRYSLSPVCKRKDLITLLRNYFTCQVRPERQTFVPNKTTKQVMDDDVLRRISAGVLAGQQQMLKQANTCQVSSANTQLLKRVVKVEEEKNIVLNTGFVLKITKHHTVTWFNADKRVHCTCNALTYKGMPCLHITCAAQTTKSKIPLSCFNPRFYRVQLISSEDQYQHDPDETSLQLPHPEETTFEVVDADTLHITDAWLNSMYNDPDSVELRGHVQVLETLFVKLLAVGKPKNETINLVHKYQRQLQDELVKLMRKNSRNGTVPNGMIPRARSRIRAESFRTVPQAVRTHREKALRMLSIKTKNMKRVTINKKRKLSKHALTPGGDE